MRHSLILLIRKGVYNAEMEKEKKGVRPRHFRMKEKDFGKVSEARITLFDLVYYKSIKDHIERIDLRYEKQKELPLPLFGWKNLSRKVKKVRGKLFCHFEEFINYFYR